MRCATLECWHEMCHIVVLAFDVMLCCVMLCYVRILSHDMTSRWSRVIELTLFVWLMPDGGQYITYIGTIQLHDSFVMYFIRKYQFTLHYLVPTPA